MPNWRKCISLEQLFPQPFTNKPVIDNITVIGLIHKFPLNKRFKRRTYTAKHMHKITQRLEKISMYNVTIFGCSSFNM